MPRADDIFYNAVGAIADESGNDTGTGSGESLEFKLEKLDNIDSVEVTLTMNEWRKLWRLYPKNLGDSRFLNERVPTRSRPAWALGCLMIAREQQRQLAAVPRHDLFPTCRTGLPCCANGIRGSGLRVSSLSAFILVLSFFQ